MQADDLQAGLVGQASHFGALGRRDLAGCRTQRKRGDLDPGVAALAGEVKCPLVRPALKGLVADREVHIEGVAEKLLASSGARCRGRPHHDRRNFRAGQAGGFALYIWGVRFCGAALGERSQPSGAEADRLSISGPAELYGTGRCTIG